MKIILHDWPPLFARGVAGIAAACGLAVIAILRGQRLTVPVGAYRRLALAAAINVFVWMGFSTLAMVWLKVSEGALLVYTMPIWTTLFAWPLLGVRPTPRGLAALMLGVVGVGIMLAGPDLTLNGGKLPGICLALAAAILFAVGTLSLRSSIPMPPLALAAWQVGLGCLPMVLLGLLFERPRLGALGLPGLAGMVYMALVPMGLCYLGWFAALDRLPAATASTAMLLVPVVGIVAAGIMLGEALGPRELVAVCLTLAGVGLAVKRS